MFLQKIEKNLPAHWYWHRNWQSVYQLRKLPALDVRYDYHHHMTELNDVSDLVDVECVYQIENPFMYAQFQLKKAEYEANGDFEVKELYHCTGQHNVESIAEHNLDWRQAYRVKYGKGVSFAPSLHYANYYACRQATLDRAMLICDVLIGKHEEGDNRTILPNEGYDTTTDKDECVFVKYYDNEFYPKAAIYYKLSTKPW